MNKNYYVILGVGPNATSEEIRSAYRQRAQELHPDHYGPDREPFLALQEAYQALSGPAQRGVYDEEGQERAVARFRAGVEPLRAGNAESGRTRGFSKGPISIEHSFETYGPSFEELFARFWSNFENVTRPKAEHIANLTVEVPLSLEEANRGGRTRLMIPARAMCPNCRGHGFVGAYECWRCAGHGAITADYPLEVAYPAGIFNAYAVQISLEDFGIQNFYLTVRFRVTNQA